MDRDNTDCRTPPLVHGWLAELSHGGVPFTLRGWCGESLPLEADATHFGFVLDGPATLEGDAGRFALASEMHFCLPGAGRIGWAGRGIVVSQPQWRGQFQIGGPLEPEGRLRYIDGCSDSLLVPPVLRGDACLNHLFIPPGTNQTAHTHPSFRAGLVVSGEGECRTEAGTAPLATGVVFALEADRIHSFHTRDRAMTIVAFHPDSDCGPAHDDHPMLNRTYVEGVSAARRRAAAGSVRR